MCTSKLRCPADEKKNEKEDTAPIALVLFLDGTQIIVKKVIVLVSSTASLLFISMAFLF